MPLRGVRPAGHATSGSFAVMWASIGPVDSWAVQAARTDAGVRDFGSTWGLMQVLSNLQGRAAPEGPT